MSAAEPLWLAAFIDLAPEEYDSTARFWVEATGYPLSPPRGVYHEFATLLPTAGRDYLRAQRLARGPSRIHLDLHVAEVATARVAAVSGGATVLAEPGPYAVLRSPAGLTFCLVPNTGAAGAGEIPPADTWPGGRRSRVSQVCIDLAADRFDAEVAFFSALTGWELQRFSAVEHVVALARPEGLPLRVILQRVGADDTGPPARAHLEWWADDVAAEVTRHLKLGARQVQDGDYWTVLADPAGLPYCVIGRDPVTGVR